MSTKLIKDPVHGYIRVPKNYIKNIVDTCEFQRLRNIRQTSYDSLYPSSSHNRFIHSLGVYFLGNRAFKALRNNVEKYIKKDENFWKKCKHTFEIACLLHDIGHTPFSHDGENFLLVAKEEDTYQIMKKPFGQTETLQITKLYNDLLNVMQKRLSADRFKEFGEDFSATILGNNIPDKDKDKEKTTVVTVAKPHEIMSVIVALETYESFLEQEKVDIELFARAILGLQYRTSQNSDMGVYNAVIQMLNSSIIDVDRLDYIMRDTQMSGFDSTSIDIERLLDSVIIVQDEEKHYHFGYKKNAISTIENVLLAHDAERRWIQGHPVVIYDSFLVKECLGATDKVYKVKNSNLGIFQKEAMTLEGVELDNGLKLRLINDGDCLFLIKQLYNNDCPYYVREYLARDKRKSPIWKSEAEFKLVLGKLEDRQRKPFQNIFKAKKEEKEATSIGNILNATRIEEIKEEIEKYLSDETLGEEDKRYPVLIKQKQLFWLEKLEEYFTSKGMKFEIQNLTVNTFNSKIDELSKGKVPIWFDSFGESKDISEVIKVYQTKSQEKSSEDIKEMFYWFVEKNEQYDQDDFLNFIKFTADEFDKEFK